MFWNLCFLKFPSVLFVFPQSFGLPYGRCREWIGVRAPPDEEKQGEKRGFVLLYNRGSQVLISLLFASSCSFIRLAVSALFSPLRTSLWNREDPVQRKMIHQVGGIAATLSCSTQTQLSRRPENAFLHTLAERNDGTPLYCGPSGGFSGPSSPFRAEDVDKTLQQQDSGVESALLYAKAWSKYTKELLAWVEKRLSIGEIQQEGQIFRETEPNTSV